MSDRLPAILVSILAAMPCIIVGCKDDGSDDRQRDQQERILLEANAQTGMPAVRNFRERKLVKQLIEMRDQADLLTTTYLVAEQTGQLVYLCGSVGYGVPAATQYTNPQKALSRGGNPYVMAQADPNGLFSPSSAEGTWILCRDPGGSDVKPVYVEPRVIVSPFELRTRGSAQPERP